MTSLTQDQELRITCHADRDRSVNVRNHTDSVLSMIEKAGVVMTQTELGWVDDYGGAENDNWRVRVVYQGETYEDGEVLSR